MRTRVTEALIADYIARIVPVLAPIPTAFLVYDSTLHKLRWPQTICIAAGLVVELLGFSTINTAVLFWEHNRQVTKEAQRAPLWLALVLVGLYLAVLTVLTVFLDTVPALAKGAALAFPVVSLAAITNWVLRLSHRLRVREMILSLAPPYNKKEHRLIKAQLETEMVDGPARDAAEAEPEQPSRAGEGAEPGPARGAIARSEPPPRMSRQQWREVYADLDGDRAGLDAARVNEMVVGMGFARMPDSTARDWANEANRHWEGETDA